MGRDRNYGSLDYLDAADEAMEKSPFRHLLFAWVSPQRCLMRAGGLDEEMVETLREWIVNGKWNKLLSDHLDDLEAQRRK